MNSSFSSHIAAAGFSQLELMLALALGSGLCLVAAQYYQYAVHLGSVQEHLQQRAERILVLKLTAGAAVQGALYSRAVCLSYGDTQEAVGAPVLCPEWMREGESAGITIETAHAPVSAAIAPDGDILSVHGDNLYGVTQYFTARHVTSGHDALYRRRGAEGGGYQAAEELVTGWSDFRVSGCYRDQEAEHSEWQCDSARGSARAFNVLRICARHETLPAAVTRVVGEAVAEFFPAHTCLIMRTL